LLTSPAWLTAARVRSVHETRGDLAERRMRPGRPGVLAGLGARPGGGVAHREHGQGQPGDDVADAEQFRGRAQPEPGGQVSGGQRGDSDAEVAGGLVDAEREAAAAGADQVDLHVDRHRPGQALVDAQQDVGGDHPGPAGAVGEHERHRQADDPARDQDGLARVTRGDRAADGVRDGLGEAEDHDERRDGDLAEVKLLGTDQRRHGAFQADHAADEEIHHRQQDELAEVGAQPQLHAGLIAGAGPPAGAGRTCHLPSRSGRPVAVAQSCAPPASTARPVCPARWSMLAAVMARSP
jgi:hypothetical protein